MQLGAQLVEGWTPDRSRSPGTCEHEGLRAPSTSTIRRILHAAGLITPEPRKRPAAPTSRFQAAQPNETWQSDFTHWRLADGTDVEILNWLDDHSRYLLSCTAHQPVTGDDVVATFLAVDRRARRSGLHADRQRPRLHRPLRRRPQRVRIPPAAARRPGRRTASPGHPQTQGKIERFHQTLKRWLPPDPRPTTRPSCKASSTSSATTTTSTAPTARSTAHPGRRLPRHPEGRPTGNGHAQGHYRLRYDRLDTAGKMSLRRAGRMHHLGIGAAHARKRVLAMVSGALTTQLKGWSST